MTKIWKWVDVLEQNEEKIIDELVNMYEEACKTNSGLGLFHCLDIDLKGIINTYTLTSGSTDGMVWNGLALEIARTEEFDVMEYVELDDVIQYLKDIEKYTDWLNWLKQNNYMEIEEDDDEAYYFVYTISDWDKKVWDEYIEEVRENFIAFEAMAWAEKQFEITLDNAKEEAIFLEREAEWKMYC